MIVFPENTDLTTIVKAKRINEKEQIKKNSYYWILPEELSADVGNIAFVETNNGPQILHITKKRSII